MTIINPIKLLWNIKHIYCNQVIETRPPKYVVEYSLKSGETDVCYLREGELNVVEYTTRFCCCIPWN